MEPNGTSGDWERVALEGESAVDEPMWGALTHQLLDPVHSFLPELRFSAVVKRSQWDPMSVERSLGKGQSPSSQIRTRISQEPRESHAHMVLKELWLQVVPETLGHLH